MKKLEIKQIAEQLSTDEQLKILSGEMREEHGLDTGRDSLYQALRFRHDLSDFYAQVAVFYQSGKLSVKPTP